MTRQLYSLYQHGVRLCLRDSIVCTQKTIINTNPHNTDCYTTAKSTTPTRALCAIGCIVDIARHSYTAFII